MTLSPALQKAADRLAEGGIANLERLRAYLLAEMDARIEARVAEALAVACNRTSYDA